MVCTRHVLAVASVSFLPGASHAEFVRGLMLTMDVYRDVSCSDLDGRSETFHFVPYSFSGHGGELCFVSKKHRINESLELYIRQTTNSWQDIVDGAQRNLQEGETDWVWQSSGYEHAYIITSSPYCNVDPREALGVNWMPRSLVHQMQRAAEMLAINEARFGACVSLMSSMQAKYSWATASFLDNLIEQHTSGVSRGEYPDDWREISIKVKAYKIFGPLSTRNGRLLNDSENVSDFPDPPHLYIDGDMSTCDASLVAAYVVVILMAVSFLIILLFGLAVLRPRC